MEFVDYLQIRHETLGGRQIGLTSAKQYNNRLENLMRYRIYNGEGMITPQIIEMINKKYVNKTGEYERTLKYYFEYKKYRTTQNN
jgi:hypothetical protein